MTLPPEDTSGPRPDCYAVIHLASGAVVNLVAMLGRSDVVSDDAPITDWRPPKGFEARKYSLTTMVEIGYMYDPLTDTYTKPPAEPAQE